MISPLVSMLVSILPCSLWIDIHEDKSPALGLVSISKLLVESSCFILFYGIMVQYQSCSHCEWFNQYVWWFLAQFLGLAASQIHLDDEIPTGRPEKLPGQATTKHQRSFLVPPGSKSSTGAGLHGIRRADAGRCWDVGIYHGLPAEIVDS